MPSVHMGFTDKTFEKFDDLVSIGLTDKKIRQQSYIVINQVGGKHKIDIAKRVREFVTIKSSVAKKQIGFVKAKQGKTATGKIIVSKSKRPPISAFTHTVKAPRKGGVSYKINKKGGRKTISDAFAVKGWRIDKDASGKDDIFVRYPNKGKNYKLRRLWGPSLWGVFVKNNLIEQSKKDIRERLTTGIDRRIQFLIHKHKLKMEKS